MLGYGRNRRQRTLCSDVEEVVFSDDSEDFSLVSDVVDVVVRSEDEVVVTEVWERVSVTVTISFVGDVSVGTIVWIPESLSHRSATPDNVYEKTGRRGCGRNPEEDKERRAKAQKMVSKKGG